VNDDFHCACLASYLRTERHIGWRCSQPDNAVQRVQTTLSFLVNDRVQLILEWLVTDAEQRHKLDRIVGLVNWLDDQRGSCDVARTQRPHTVSTVTCSNK